MIYKSKIDWWFYILVTLFVLIPIFIWTKFFYSGYYFLIVIGIVFTIIDCLFIIPLMIDTKYIIEEDYLHIKSWICYNKKINYKDIISIEETRNPISSPALSIDRIVIKYISNTTEEAVLISPVDKKEFLEELNLCYRHV